MTKVNFTAEEADWLTQLLLQRLSLYNEKNSPRPKIIDNCVSAMFKLEDKLSVNLKDWEKTMCISVVNENLPAYYSKVKVSDAFSLVSMTDKQKVTLAYIDMGKSILKKLRMEKKETLKDYNFGSFYSDKYAALKKLKGCEQIYISKVEENNIYKIGFVYQGREVSVYEMSQIVRSEDLTFYTITGEAINYGNRHFSLVTDRKGALDLLSGCDEGCYPANQLAFFKQLLN